jgi:hypothetical protein
MILQSVRARRHIAFGVTLLLLLISYAGLRMAALPRANFIARHYDEINWTRFLPQPKPMVVSELNEPAPQTSQPAHELADIAEAPRAPQRMDLSAELKNLEIDLSQPASRAAEMKNNPGVTRQEMPSLLESDLNINLDFDVTNLETQLPARGGRVGNKSGSDIQIASGGHAEVGSGLEQGNSKTNAGLGLPGRGGPTRGKEGKASVQVALKGLNDFGEGYRNFTPIYKALVEWMRRHPADLAEVVERFMGFQPGNLTSHLTFNAGGQEFEMFLLCVEPTYEIRIALVHENEVTYLIDQGFKKQSNYLRVGSLTRQAEGEIHRFGSVLREASDYRTQEFYQIFLSWWETVKHEVRK